MIEQESPWYKLEFKVTRRGLFKLGAYGAVGAAAAIAGNEIGKSIRGIETDSGIFYPLYENHKIGIKPQDIPQADFLFRELHFSFSKSPVDILTETLRGSPTTRILPDEILSKLESQKTRVAFGDIKVPDQTTLEVSEWELGLTLLALYPGLVVARRQFLKNVALTAGLWGISGLASGLSLYLTSLNNTPDALNKSIQRIRSLETKIHPEISLVFFRDIVMADKLLLIAEDFRKQNSRKAKVVFQVGASHSGIEDYLQAGHSFCRNMILAYPSFWLRHVVEDLNNGIEDFSSVLLLTLSAQGQDLSQTTTTRILDKKLHEGLKSKF